MSTPSVHTDGVKASSSFGGGESESDDEAEDEDEEEEEKYSEVAGEADEFDEAVDFSGWNNQVLGAW